MRLAIAASATGTLLEWYDLFLAIILAKTLSHQFFPADNSAAFLETLAIVGSSYLIRPIGSLIFGSIGDRSGRKKSFLISLLLMGSATFLIGLLPTFNQIGWLAPIILLVLRLAQGLALSGEYSGAIIYVSENSPIEKRGYYTGFIQATVPLGLLLCLLVVIAIQSSMSADAFNQWGWRLPFLLSAVLVFFSFMLRRKMEETPVFTEMKATGNISTSPIKESLDSWQKIKKILSIVFGGNAAQSTIMQTSQFVTLYFLQRAVKIDEITSMVILAVALLLGTPFFQWSGAWSDKYGRKKVIYYGMIMAFITIPLSFYLFYTYGNPLHLDTPHTIPVSTTLFFIFLTFITTVAGALLFGPIGVWVMEFFEGRTRYTSMGFTHNISNGVIGGTTPFIPEFLKVNMVVGASLSPYIGLIYPMGIILIALIVNPFITEPENEKRI